MAGDMVSSLTHYGTDGLQFINADSHSLGVGESIITGSFSIGSQIQIRMTAPKPKPGGSNGLDQILFCDRHVVVVRKPGSALTRDSLLRFYDGKIAKWWTPDDVVFVDAIPLGATGKMQKIKLREQFRGHKLPTA